MVYLNHKDQGRSILGQAWFSFRFFFNRLGCLLHCEDQLHYHGLTRTGLTITNKNDFLNLKTSLQASAAKVTIQMISLQSVSLPFFPSNEISAKRIAYICGCEISPRWKRNFVWREQRKFPSPSTKFFGDPLTNFSDSQRQSANFAFIYFAQNCK